MTRAATPENEAHLLQVARHGTAQHVEKLVRKFARASRLADARHAQREYEAREFCWYYDDDGMLVFRGRLPAAEGAAFVKAMEVLVPYLGRQEAAEPYHRLLHEEGFALLKGTEGLEFVPSDGSKLPRALATQFADAGDQNGDLAIEAEDDALGLHIDARTAVTRWLGESLDYGFAVGTLMDIAEAQARRLAGRSIG